MIGMVFQKPNPFPKSIYQNVAFGLKVNGFSGDLDTAVERSLRQAALWPEVKDRLGDSALTLSGGQQQRVAVARALANDPAIVLADEPTANIDPANQQSIVDLIKESCEEFNIALIIVTHAMEVANQFSRIDRLDDINQLAVQAEEAIL